MPASAAWFLDCAGLLAYSLPVALSTGPLVELYLPLEHVDLFEHSVQKPTHTSFRSTSAAGWGAEGACSRVPPIHAGQKGTACPSGLTPACRRRRLDTCHVARAAFRYLRNVNYIMAPQVLTPAVCVTPGLALLRRRGSFAAGSLALVQVFTLDGDGVPGLREGATIMGTRQQPSEAIDFPSTPTNLFPP